MTIQMSRITIIPAGFMQIRAPKTAAAVGWWVVPGKTCIGAYQAKGAASLAASYVNLASPGVGDLVAVTAPAGGWDVGNGWKFTNVPAGGCLQAPTVTDGYTFLMQFTNAVAANAYMCTTVDGFWRMRQRAPGIDVEYTYKAGMRYVPPWITAGNYGMAAGQGYRNGAADGTPASGASVINSAMYIGAATYPAAMYVRAYVLYSAILTAPQMLAVATAMAAL